MIDRDTPAFPRQRQELPNGNVIHNADGMSLRDYFAAKALPSAFEWYQQRLDAGDMDTVSDAEIAKYAYELADAMMKARDAS